MDKEMTLYKLKQTPKSGRVLWSYMAAILEVTGMDKGNIFPLKKFMSNFKTHIDEERIVRREDGYQLTNKGKAYFADRYNAGNRQHIDRADVEVMIRGIKTGYGPDEWEEIK